MEKYTLVNGSKQETIEYAGFKLEDKYCFYCNGTMLYFSKTSINEMLESGKLIKLE